MSSVQGERRGLANGEGNSPDTERSGTSAGAEQSYQSFSQYFTPFGDDTEDLFPDQQGGTSDLVRHANLVLVHTTQIKLVGSLLLGFSLLTLLSSPPGSAEIGDPDGSPSAGGDGGAAAGASYHVSGEALAKLLLGTAVATTFAATTFAMLEAHYVHTLSSASERYLSARKEWAMRMSRASFGHTEDGAFGGERYSEGDPEAGDRVLRGGDSGNVDSDARLAAKFQALLMDLEKMRKWARGGLWFSMVLLILATLLRLGRGDLGFVVLGAVIVCVFLALAATPVLRRLRSGYAPLIREYRGLSRQQSQLPMSAAAIAATTPTAGLLGRDAERFL